MQKILKLFRRTRRRLYGHIISLGYNCEVSFQFFKKYKFVESSLFAWVNTSNCDNLIYALNNLEKLMSMGFKKAFPMYVDIATGIYFHGKDGKEDSESIIIDELTSRIMYLRDKFIKTAADGKKNLYIFKYPAHNFSQKKATEDITKLYNALTTLVKNKFDLLIISEKKNDINISSFDNLFIRYVDFYTPEEAVTTKPYDQKGYAKIFSEFCPDFKLEKKKKFKFEALDG